MICGNAPPAPTGGGAATGAGAAAIIGAGAVIPVGKKIPPGSKVMGVPGKVVGEVSEWEATMMIGGGHHEYQKLLGDYKGGGSGE